MKKNILTLSLYLLVTGYSFAENWQDKWSESILLMEKSQFTDAKTPMDDAISLMEGEGNIRSYLYVDRARLNLLLGNQDQVLTDIEKALSSGQLDNQEKIRAITTKLMVNGCLGIFETALDDLKLFAELAPLPVMEIKDGKLIIRNIPNSEYYKKMISCYLIHSGICYDKEDFVWLKSHMLIAEKINHCGCQKCIAEYAKTRVCDACLSIVNPTKENVSVDDLIIASIKYCSVEVKQLEDQIACLIALSQVQQNGSSIELFTDTFDNIFHEIDKTQPVFWD